MNHQQLGSTDPGGAAKGESIQNKGARHAISVRPSSVAPSHTPPLNNVRHRGPNPAIVGGLGNTKNGGAINGTWMIRKP